MGTTYIKINHKIANCSIKARGKNFTKTELLALVDAIEARRKFLFGPLQGPTLTQYHRDRAWEKVVEAVNAVAPVVRTTKDIKKKFKDLKTRTKQKANAFKRSTKKTGGGENEETPLNEMEQKIISFIGTESIEGIAGGIDTFQKRGKYI
ncbi:hypothetical protein Zmor_017859 [Zophobas morio]|uniref:Regulatory protein zeste n=1 Tax=Zophobas morio TaxID=2755281 RepID=A0AA38ICC7_9CUCU|nr:hypothetical protein Zmor_003788 [Zophobas morio]KAJ3651851.1 hypothetical protein Zmor_017859 [Zophobas morio]